MPALQRAAARLEEACSQGVETVGLEPLLQVAERELSAVLASLQEKGLA
jgi:hypothetical protein